MVVRYLEGAHSIGDLKSNASDQNFEIAILFKIVQKVNFGGSSFDW